MVAEIKTPKSLKKALNYNEKKVEKGQAELLYAHNFLKVPEEMNFYDKQERFDYLHELNERSQVKTFHVSLNFHPSEAERLTPEFMVQLASEYMEKIGFGKQPYLVYQHFDAGHPHCHVLSSLIQEDGSRINTNYIGRDISDPVRKELEEKYDLVKATKQELVQQQEEYLKVDAQKVQYGKSETKRSITNVLDAVIEKYKYASLPELNAVLQQYNVIADRGQEEGRIYKNRGLTYRVLDEEGQKVGVPIKASSIYSKPTLDYIEQKFQENEIKREKDRQRLKTAIDWTLHKQPDSVEKFLRELEKERVAVVVRRSEQGRVYGLTYIDHETKAVFNGSDLGKEYAAKRVLERLNLEQKQEIEKTHQQQWERDTKEKQPTSKISDRAKDQEETSNRTKQNKEPDAYKPGSRTELSKAIEQFFAAESPNESMNRELTEEEKRKRKRQQEREL